MKIVILNESFLSQKHLETLRTFGDVVIFENTHSEELAIERLKDADIAIADCYIAPLHKKVLESTSKLQLLCINSTGYDLVDTKTATEKGIKVANVPGFATDSAAEQTIALMFAVIRKIPLGDSVVRTGEVFEIDPGNREQRKYLGSTMRGKTLGVVGLGSIGQRVCELGNGIGMHVLGFNRSVKDIQGVKQVSLETLLIQSDVVSINLPLNTDTENIISEKELSLMKPNAVLINTGRGKNVDNKALFTALQEKNIAGAGLDVLDNSHKDNPLLQLENVVFSPHSGFFTQESLENIGGIIIANIEAFIKANPTNIVN